MTNEKSTLFVGDRENYHLNACVGLNGGYSNFRDYAGGFLKGAEAIAAACEDPAAYLDTMVYPLALCYRHSTELAIKQLILTISNTQANSLEFEKSHDLCRNWLKVEGYLRSTTDIEVDIKSVSEVDKIIREYDKFDRVGMVFRYPEDRNGNLHLQDTALINVKVLSERMTATVEQLLDWDYEIDEFWQNVCSLR